MNKAKSSPTFPGFVRIIGGSWRGRKLKALNSPGLRPTPNRVRETLFNWLQMWIEGSHCLDLFSGTGSLCLESLSRGAAEAVFVEENPQVVKILTENIAQFAQAPCEVVNSSALNYLDGTPRPFDIVFVDPPFNQAQTLIPQCLQLLTSGWLSHKALVYVEQEARSPVEIPPLALKKIKEKTTGQVHYSLYVFEKPE